MAAFIVETSQNPLLQVMILVYLDRENLYQLSLYVTFVYNSMRITPRVWS